VKCPASGVLARSLYDMELYTNRKLARGYSEFARYPKFLGELYEPVSKRVGLIWLREASADTLESYLNSFRVPKLAGILGDASQASGVPRRRLCGLLLVQLLGILEQLQDFDIIHRDLKPENILVSPTDEQGVYLKAIDFGSACEWNGFVKKNLDNATCDPVYSPPERRLRRFKPPFAFDIYSIGLIALRAALPSLTDNGSMKYFVDDILAANKYSLERAVNSIVSNTSNAINVPYPVQQDFVQFNRPNNDDLFSILCLMLAEKPEDRATAKSGLKCRFLKNEGLVQ